MVAIVDGVPGGRVTGGGLTLGRLDQAHLLNDAWRGLFESAVVISNATDLVLPIRMVTEELKLPLVVCPGRWQAAS